LDWVSKVLMLMMSSWIRLLI